MTRSTTSFQPHDTPDFQQHHKFRARLTNALRKPLKSAVRNADSSAPIGTRQIDFSGLSVPVITAVQPSPKFWLYLAGFDRRVTDADVKLIVSRCLSLDEAPQDVVRLVPRGTDINQLSFISFKVGLDPALKQRALVDIWPEGISFREFIEQPKNFQRPSQHPGNGNASSQ